MVLVSLTIDLRDLDHRAFREREGLGNYKAVRFSSAAVYADQTRRRWRAAAAGKAAPTPPQIT